VVLMPFGVVVRQEEASRAAPWDGRPAEGGPRSLTGRHRLPPPPAVAARPGPGVRTGEAEWPMAPWETGPITMPSEAAAAGPAPASPGPAAPTPAAPASGSHLGMPIRVPQASMAPQLRDQRDADPQDLRGLQAAEDDVPWFGARSPEATRSMLTMMQHGWRRGRMDDLDDPEGVPGMGTD